MAENPRVTPSMHRRSSASAFNAVHVLARVGGIEVKAGKKPSGFQRAGQAGGRSLQPLNPSPVALQHHQGCC